MTKRGVKWVENRIELKSKNRSPGDRTEMILVSYVNNLVLYLYFM